MEPGRRTGSRISGGVNTAQLKEKGPTEADRASLDGSLPPKGGRRRLVLRNGSEVRSCPDFIAAAANKFTYGAPVTRMLFQHHVRQKLLLSQINFSTS